MNKVLFHICFLTAFWVLASQDAPETEIDQGILRGKFRQTWKGRIFKAFTGIPYAKPPIGDLRFKSAVPAEPWTGILDASKPHAVCPQVDVFFGNHEVKGDEDCLYLNVYTPQVRLTNSNNESLPVLFYIHGGGWTFGAANPDFYGPDILLDKDVVLVTINYRLGALGFLTTGDELVPGNNGLKDQNLALKWVKKNIYKFGGDPSKITIFGQSAGGASTHYHVLSPLSKDLISGAIAHSGIALATWALSTKGETLQNSQRLAEFLDCPSSTSQEMIDCLEKVNAYDIVRQDTKFMEYSYDPVVPFKPVIEPDTEGAFLTAHPIEIIKSGRVADVPFITGMTSEDGAVKAASLYNNSNLIEELDKDFNKLAPLVIQYDKVAHNKDDVTKKIRKFYFGDGNVDYSTKAQLTNMLTDAYFFAPQNLAAKLHAKYLKQPVYYFIFGYKGSISFGPFFGDAEHDYGVCHGDELNYLLSNNLFENYKPSKSDEQMIDILTTLWTNFAATGNPTPKTVQPNLVNWEPVHEEKLSYYFIKTKDVIEMTEDLYSERAIFWESLPIYSNVDKTKDEL